MQLEMTFKNMEASARVKEFVDEKSRSLKKFFHGNLHLKWILSSERDTHIAHVHLTGKDLDFFVEDEEKNLFTLVENCVEKLERQLQKKKEQIQDHHKG